MPQRKPKRESTRESTPKPPVLKSPSPGAANQILADMAGVHANAAATAVAAYREGALLTVAPPAAPVQGADSAMEVDGPARATTDGTERVETPVGLLHGLAPRTAAASPAPSGRSGTPNAMAALAGGGDASIPLPAVANPHGDPARKYLNDHVTNPLLAGIRMIAKTQPKDPLRVLGEYLINFANEQDNKKA